MLDRPTTVLAEARPLSGSPVPDAQAIIEEARRHHRRRRRRTALIVAAATVVVGTVALASSASLLETTTPGRTGRGTPTGPPLVTGPSPLTLDLFWSVPTGKNVSINLHTGAVRTVSDLGPVYGIARQGYILGFTLTVVGTFSYDLRHTYSTWTGRYGENPVPANDPRYVWVSTGTGSATEVNRSEHPVAPSVTIPAGTAVVGQAGPDLVLIGSPPAQELELWSPSQQRMVADLGSQEYSAALPAAGTGTIVWASRDMVHVDAADGGQVRLLTGPSGDYARVLAISPDGSEVAVVFQPEPGTAGAGKGGVVVTENITTGSSVTVPGSTGALNLLAWSPDGRLVFFPRLDTSRNSVTMATYRIGNPVATPLPIPGLHIPADLNGAWGSVLVGSAPANP